MNTRETISDKVFGEADVVNLKPDMTFSNCVFEGCAFEGEAQDLYFMNCKFSGRAAEWVLEGCKAELGAPKSLRA